MTETPIDRAHSRMTAAPDDDRLRLALYERIADAELFLLLENEARGENVSPRIFETGEGRFVLAFDRESRLTAFAEGPAPYAALSGRSLAGMLAGRSLGMGLNLADAPSAMLIPPEAIDWLAATLAGDPAEAEEIPAELRPPQDLPESLVTALDAKLATAEGLAEFAYLAAVTWKSGRRGHLLAIVEPVRGAEEALARAVREALVFSGLEAGELDVAFIRASDPAAGRLAKVGLRFDLPKAPRAHSPQAPGTDPSKPPRLR